MPCPARIHSLVWTLLFLVCLGPLLAQEDSVFMPNAPLEEAVEDLILNVGVDEQVDYSDFTEPLQEFLQSPLDLNTASLEELLLLPEMNAIQAQRLHFHIETFGALTSIYELQAVEGYTLPFIRTILPYVTVEKIGATDVDPDQRFPRGPSFQEIVSGMEYEWLQRMTGVMEPQRGYSDPDTTFRDLQDAEGNFTGVDTLLSTRYRGDPYRHYTRIRGRLGQNVSIGLVGEKDPGETFAWRPEERLYGYDFLSAHLALRNFGRLKALMIGDYTLQFGQGLLLSRGLGFGKGAQVINGLKMPAYGPRPYSSVNENQFFRGAAATYGLGDWQLTGFFSRAFRDASVQLIDTIDEEVIAAGNLQLSGLHRTPNEFTNRKRVGETIYGGRAEYRKGTFRGGITHYQLRYDALLNPGDAFYQTFAFRGNRHHATGVDWDWVKGNVNLFGEIAHTRGNAFGGTASLMSSLAATVDFSLGLRHFDKDFFSPFAYVFAERPINAQGETGVYAGLRYAPNYHWELQTYFDQYQFHWQRFRVHFPSQGWEWMAQLQYRPTRGTIVYLRVRTEQGVRSPSSSLVRQTLGTPLPVQRDQFRIHFQTSMDRKVNLKTRLELSRFQESGQPTSFGYLLYQDVAWRWGFRWRLTGRFAVFDIDNYDARIYAYESDILGFFSIPPYYRKGTRWYLMFNGKLTRQLDIWLRVSRTSLANNRSWQAAAPAAPGEPAGSSWEPYATFGNGLEAISGSARTDLRVQLRYKF